MKVTVEVLQRVYNNMQEQGDHINAVGEEYLDPESHLHVIDAYEMPLWNWSLERATFEKYAQSSKPLQFIDSYHRYGHTMSAAGSAETRVLALRNRLHIIKQSVLRNEHFAPSTIPSRDREHLVTVRIFFNRRYLMKNSRSSGQQSSS